MGDIAQFRIARAPQRVAIPSDVHLAITDGPTLQYWLGSGQLLELAGNFLQELGLLAPARRFSHSDPTIAATLQQVRWLDDLLTSHNNTVLWTSLHDLVHRRLDGEPAQVIARGGWGSLREALSLALVAAAVTSATPALRSDILRLLLVMGLLELIAAKGPIDADAVFAALRWRNVLFPSRLLEAAGVGRSILARQPGVSDLYVVREEWARYEIGEIAHIENVLKGELKERVLERTEERETTQVTDRETTRLDEHDLQTTDRFELKQETEREMALAFHVDGKLDVKGSYGMVSLEAHVGASFDYSVKEAERRAFTQSRETVARAVSRVEERVREQRTARTLTRIHSADKHSLDNAKGTDNVAGVYRWVDKIKTVQLFKYPHRLLFEFQIPEPGAFIRWTIDHGGSRGLATLAPEPLVRIDAYGNPVLVNGKPVPLQPSDITSNNYQQWIARYSVVGVEPPPPQRATVTDVLSLAMQEAESAADKTKLDLQNKAIAVPSNYSAISWRAAAISSDVISGDPYTQDPNSRITRVPNILLIVGGASGNINFPTQAESTYVGTGSGQITTSPMVGLLPVAVGGVWTKGFELTVTLECDLLPSALAAWQGKSYETIANAYWSLKQRHEEEKAARLVQRGISIEGSAPARNAEVVREELKRSVVELLSGSRFNGRPATTAATDDMVGRIDFDRLKATQAEIQFVEQAFEWENLTFILYPYFWADAEKWADLHGIESPDADFDRFLRSGSARVVVPARPGFEWPAQLYSLFGTLWAGGPAPVPNDDLYLSIAEEVRAQQQPPKDGTPGESWEVRLPTTLVYLSPVGTTLPIKNTDAKLPAKST